MRQEHFIARHQGEWQALEDWLQRQEKPRKKQPPPLRPLDAGSFPPAFRRLCQQLSLAERRGYSPWLIDRLRGLMERGHRLLYRPPAPRWRTALDFVARGFPRRVREHRWYLLASALLFFGPLLGFLVLLQFRPELVHSVLDPQTIAQMEQMYDPAERDGALGRSGGSDIAMFGVYVFNNVSIGFRTLASGLLLGLGSLYVIVYNGVVIGTVAGHLTAIGHGGPFWRFVAGHAAPELGAIVIAGAGGLRLGLTLIAPGRLGRRQAFLRAGLDTAWLALGVFFMLVFAAFVEAFWSSIPWLPDPVKFGVGFALWGVLGVWLWLGGRGGADAPR
jgi:uncharacterized membrane protein SpoIIM required for sporulation